MDHKWQGVSWRLAKVAAATLLFPKATASAIHKRSASTVPGPTSTLIIKATEPGRKNNAF